MVLIVFLLSIWIFFKTISYGIYEIKENKNKTGGISVIVLAIISLIILPVSVLL